MSVTQMVCGARLQVKQAAFHTQTSTSSENNDTRSLWRRTNRQFDKVKITVCLTHWPGVHQTSPWLVQVSLLFSTHETLVHLRAMLSRIISDPRDVWFGEIQ